MTSQKAVVLKAPLEPEPSDCCGSGCARCVWDIYYDKLAEYEEQVKLQQTNASAGEGKQDEGEGHINGERAANDEDEDEDEEEDSFFDLNGVDTQRLGRRGASQEPPTAFSPSGEASNSLLLRLFEKKLPHAPKSTGSIVLRYADDHNCLSAHEAMELMMSGAFSSPSLGEGKGVYSSSVVQLGRVVAERGPPNSAFADCLLIKAEHDRKMILGSSISGTEAVKAENSNNCNTRERTNLEDEGAGSDSSEKTALCELNSLQQEVGALRRLQTTVTNNRANNNSNYTGNWARIVAVERLGVVEGAGAVKAVAPEGNGGTPLLAAKERVQTDTTQSVAGGFSNLNPLVGLRVALSRTVGDEETLMPGDVVQILAPNDTDLCVAILKRLKLTNPARRVTLMPSPFASPNSFPSWLAPASVVEKVCSISNAAVAQKERENVIQKAKAFESSIDGLLQAQQQQEEERLAALETRRGDNNSKNSNKREGSIGASKTSDEPISPELDLGTVSARSLLSVFKHYVDITTSAYLRPTFFAMLCRAAEASVGRPLPTTEAEAHELISTLPFVKKARDISSQSVAVRAGSTSPSSSSLGTDKLTDFVLLRFLATGAPPRVLSMLIAEQKPTMLTILEAFPTVAPQLPRLLEVCTPLRPRMFSIAGLGGCGGGASVPHLSVDIFIRAFGSGPMLVGLYPPPCSGGENDHHREGQSTAMTETLHVVGPTPTTGEATPSHRLTSDSTAGKMSTASAARDFRLAVEKLFLESEFCGSNILSSGVGDNLLQGSSNCANATTPGHFVGHTSGRLVQEMLRPSSSSFRLSTICDQNILTTCDQNISPLDSFPPQSSANDIANALWARIQRTREHSSLPTRAACTLSANHTQNKQQARSVGLFPSIPADKPLILVGAGSGYAPLRAVLRERLCEASAPLLEGDVSDPTSSSPALKKKRCGATVLLCSVRTVEEAFAIDKLISEDIYEILGHSTTTRGNAPDEHAALTAPTTTPTADIIIGSKRGRDSNINKVNASCAPSSSSSLHQEGEGASPTNNDNDNDHGRRVVIDIEDIRDAEKVQSSAPPIAAASTAICPYYQRLPIHLRVERHFFISSASSGALQSKAISRKNVHHHYGSVFFHEGRLVNWYSPSGAGVRGRRALCRFPSAMAACMLFAAVSGSATSPRDSSSSLSGLTTAKKRATNFFSFSMWPERDSFSSTPSSTSSVPNSSFFDRTVAAVAKERGTGVCGGFAVEACEKIGVSHRTCENCPRRRLNKEIDGTTIGKQSFVLPDTRDAHIYACGPEVFLASVYKGLQHLLEWGPSLETASSGGLQQEQKQEEMCYGEEVGISSSGGGGSGDERTPTTTVVNSNTGLSSQQAGEYDLSRPPINDESEAEYEMRKHFFNKHIIFDYWKE